VFTSTWKINLSKLARIYWQLINFQMETLLTIPELTLPLFTTYDSLIILKGVRHLSGNAIEIQQNIWKGTTCCGLHLPADIYRPISYKKKEYESIIMAGISGLNDTNVREQLDCPICVANYLLHTSHYERFPEPYFYITK
jgi:hypothetical protein